MSAPYDVRDRRANGMQKALDAIDNCVSDLSTFASTPLIPGVAYSVADRLLRLRGELAEFGPRDLLPTRRPS